MTGLVDERIGGTATRPHPTAVRIGRKAEWCEIRQVRFTAGSTESWMPSPIRLIDSTMISSASPGK